MQALKGEGQLLESMLCSANEEKGELLEMVEALQREKTVLSVIFFSCYVYIYVNIDVDTYI
jgi:hypothetical protein